MERIFKKYIGPFLKTPFQTPTFNILARNVKIDGLVQIDEKFLNSFSPIIFDSLSFNDLEISFPIHIFSKPVIIKAKSILIKIKSIKEQSSQEKKDLNSNQAQEMTTGIGVVVDILFRASFKIGKVDVILTQLFGEEIFFNLTEICLETIEYGPSKPLTKKLSIQSISAELDEKISFLNHKLFHTSNNSKIEITFQLNLSPIKITKIDFSIQSILYFNISDRLINLLENKDSSVKDSSSSSSPAFSPIGFNFEEFLKDFDEEETIKDPNRSSLFFSALDESSIIQLNSSQKNENILNAPYSSPIDFFTFYVEKLIVFFNSETSKEQLIISEIKGQKDILSYTMSIHSVELNLHTNEKTFSLLKIEKLISLKLNRTQKHLDFSGNLEIPFIFFNFGSSKEGNEFIDSLYLYGNLFEFIKKILDLQQTKKKNQEEEKEERSFSSLNLDIITNGIQISLPSIPLVNGSFEEIFVNLKLEGVSLKKDSFYLEKFDSTISFKELDKKITFNLIEIRKILIKMKTSEKLLLSEPNPLIEIIQKEPAPKLVLSNEIEGIVSYLKKKALKFNQDSQMKISIESILIPQLPIPFILRILESEKLDLIPWFKRLIPDQFTNKKIEESSLISGEINSFQVFTKQDFSLKQNSIIFNFPKLSFLYYQDFQSLSKGLTKYLILNSSQDELNAKFGEEKKIVFQINSEFFKPSDWMISFEKTFVSILQTDLQLKKQSTTLTLKNLSFFPIHLFQFYSSLDIIPEEVFPKKETEKNLNYIDFSFEIHSLLLLRDIYSNIIVSNIKFLQFYKSGLIDVRKSLENKEEKFKEDVFHFRIDEWKAWIRTSEKAKINSIKNLIQQKNLFQEMKNESKLVFLDSFQMKYDFISNHLLCKNQKVQFWSNDLNKNTKLFCELDSDTFGVLMLLKDDLMVELNFRFEEIKKKKDFYLKLFSKELKLPILKEENLILPFDLIDDYKPKPSQLTHILQIKNIQIIIKINGGTLNNKNQNDSFLNPQSSVVFSIYSPLIICKKFSQSKNFKDWTFEAIFSSNLLEQAESKEILLEGEEIKRKTFEKITGIIDQVKNSTYATIISFPAYEKYYKQLKLFSVQTLQNFNHFLCDKMKEEISSDITPVMSIQIKTFHTKAPSVSIKLESFCVFLDFQTNKFLDGFWEHSFQKKKQVEELMKKEQVIPFILLSSFSLSAFNVILDFKGNGMKENLLDEVIIINEAILRFPFISLTKIFDFKQIKEIIEKKTDHKKAILGGAAIFRPIQNFSEFSKGLYYFDESFSSRQSHNIFGSISSSVSWVTKKTSEMGFFKNKNEKNENENLQIISPYASQALTFEEASLESKKNWEEIVQEVKNFLNSGGISGIAYKIVKGLAKTIVVYVDATKNELDPNFVFIIKEKWKKN